MDFKIDTTDTYVHIGVPAAALDEIMAAALEERVGQLTYYGSNNFLIDLSACQSADENGFEALATWHEQLYSEGRSLVFTGLQPGVLAVAKEAQLDGALNIAPTEIEAVDIISMEILERDLFGEES
ncbi:MAG: STAS domain-containing protein [Chitinophagaceae bacterium]